jgi:lipopolysaccharide export system protein LptA
VNMGVGQNAARRKKLITMLVAAGLLVTVLGVAVAYWRGRAGREKGNVPVPQALPADVHQQLSGYSFTRSEGGRQVFTIRASKLAAKEGGKSFLEDVVVELFGRSGSRRDVLRTERCEFDSLSGDVVSSGPVHIELNAQAAVLPGAGLRGQKRAELETSRIIYRQKISMVETDEPVKFQIGPITGSARGLSYDTQAGTVQLRKDIAIELPPRPGAGPQVPTRLNAGQLRYDKESSMVTLSGSLGIIQGDRRLEAQQGTVFLNSENRVTHVILDAGVHGLDSLAGESTEFSARRLEGILDPAHGQLKSIVAEGDSRVESRQKDGTARLTAQKVSLIFEGLHPQPKEGSAKGDVELVMDGTGPASLTGDPASLTGKAGRRSLNSGQLDFTFRTGGRSLKNAQTVGPGKLVLSSSGPKGGARTITAGQFQMEFDVRSRLETLLGLAQTRILFEPSPQAAPGTLPQETTAERLEAKFDPVQQTLRSMVQKGDFQFREGDRQALAEQATYLDQTQVMTLTGHPQAWDSGTKLKAGQILIDLRSETAEGAGRVESSYFGGTTGAGGARGVTPTNVLAERVKVQWKSQILHYEGHVRAWRGQDVLESTSLDVYRAERRLRSGPKVVSSHLQPASEVKGKAATTGSKQETRPVSVRADRLEYFDADRRARYQGNVELLTEGSTLRADRLDLYFSPTAKGEPGEVDHAVAEGKVKVEQPERWATGEHADYFAAPGKIIVTGGPPVLYDRAKGLTTGQRLTFFLLDDSLSVDGGEASPTQTKHRVER